MPKANVTVSGTFQLKDFAITQNAATGGTYTVKKGDPKVDATTGKKDEEITTSQKDERRDLEKQTDDIRAQKEEVLKKYGKDNQLMHQLVDLALLANNLLKGEDLSKFIKRSFDLLQ